ncbi:helix-turn-helix transcriptional regulator [Hydrogenovibrio marinus]|uniref:HTH cro/C1-type domain-containing protein n=1 Tax=Hydrogenovibrio marinus TaxID=28885 RepID=A0A066ZLZ6_HYDMR|nr:helix-turn-helix transcriptional regulator [Hydrogenovibrio marinus]KDN94833.1 hypothetical protein EI16_00520 [Hydrogenovibrio marinus]BBN59292.1 hypothetical protein HVMH_0886 [Hydrogenovibrio marinus]
MSNKKFNEKLKLIREAENLSQSELAEKTGIPKRSIINYENSDRQPAFDAVKKVCESFPEYTMYLMLDDMPENTGSDQIKPEEKKLRDLSTSEQTA